ncbi:MAG TPA: AEC family transporter [Candidatus Lachnoclostridium pullistercoris]|uniref:AEC family transporter n=1 Tax=Candidatus Lachnoclostridium pullistercoris TaxID=2838632 RepID=A0A9D2PF37_9FIRM|nr:AEC family transporter [Candidatus Lachnoclostridium pullistercoris]
MAEMEMTMVITEKILEMVFLLIVGAVVYKTGVIDAASNKKLSNFLLMVISPALIISSYQMEYDPRLLKELLLTFALSAASFAAVILFCRVVLRERPGVDSPVEKMAVIYSNCGFIGIPLINGILGAEGVFCMTAYTTVFNVLVWTHGVILMSGGGERVRLKDMWKNLVTPAVIAVVIGLALFLTGTSLPAVIANPIASVGDMNTPIAMIVAGANLAQGNLLASLKKVRVYYISFLKLIAAPVITVVLLFFLSGDFNVSMTIFVASACPAGAMGTMFALRYNRDSNYASELFAVSTILSMLTIPLMAAAAIPLLS